MLAEISFDWGTKVKRHEAEALAELLDEKFDEIVEKSREGEELSDVVELKSWTHYIVDINDVAKILPDTKYTVRKTFKSRHSFVDLLDKFKEVADKMERLPFNHEQDFNAKVNVHVPNLGLLLIDETDYMEDACTEALQDKLDAGWRILAICPQPDQRRPDYILGRTKQR